VRRLFVFPLSPYSRRVRLVLFRKSLDVELIDARSDSAARETMRRLYPMRTAPVLVEDSGLALGDSYAIANYLERAYPGPALWPQDPLDVARVAQTIALTDGALGTVIDLATRYYPLRTHDAWPGVLEDMGGRAQAALDALAATVEGRKHFTIAEANWSIGDIWLYTAVTWLEGLPARASTYAPAAQLVSLGWNLPSGLTRWADAHRQRPDVLAL
jgi:glutathione S-transferase